MNKTWNIILFSGFPSTHPTIRYYSARQKHQSEIPEKEEIERFIHIIYEKVSPPLECLIVSFIYIERLMVLFACMVEQENTADELQLENYHVHQSHARLKDMGRRHCAQCCFCACSQLLPSLLPHETCECLFGYMQLRYVHKRTHLRKILPSNQQA
eukprot:TRINITY_DN1260_c0_g1_i3.p1 TRINITY_DN1260_c0_g1~~TRINITY_DN1260_c0_g1_i3.p1  ORF type:complete len:156 (+),score=2.48 TRINITY_DN1260_c0_g1_i3:619-1086(+)